MVSKQTWQKTSGKFAGRRLGFIRVVGRGSPVEVFEPTGPDADANNNTFEQALTCCLEKKWRQALDLFESRPDDPVSRVYLENCRKIVENPVRDWDGIWELDCK